MRLRRWSRATFRHAGDDLALSLPAFLLGGRPLRVLDVDEGIDDPMRRGRLRPWNAIDPTQCVELVEDGFDLSPLKTAHGPIAALHVPVGDALQPVREDIASNRRQPTVVVREPQHARIEGESMGQQKAMQKRPDAPCGRFRDDCKVPGAASTQCQTTQRRAKMPSYLPICDASLGLMPSQDCRSRCFFSSPWR